MKIALHLPEPQLTPSRPPTCAAMQTLWPPAPEAVTLGLKAFWLVRFSLTCPGPFLNSQRHAGVLAGFGKSKKIVRWAALLFFFGGWSKSKPKT